MLTYHKIHNRIIEDGLTAGVLFGVCALIIINPDAGRTKNQSHEVPVVSESTVAQDIATESQTASMLPTLSKAQ